MSIRTQESLGIFWEGEEVDGFTLYGFWPQDEILRPELILPGGVETKSTALRGPGWSVWLWDIRVLEWPSPNEWTSFVREFLEQLTKQGAVVAWCGLEGMFVDPPELFDPSEMSGGVWAACLSPDTYFGPPALCERFEPLTDESLMMLRSAL